MAAGGGGHGGLKNGHARTPGVWSGKKKWEGGEGGGVGPKRRKRGGGGGGGHGGLKNGPPRTPALMPRACRPVTPPGQRDFADVGD